MPGADGVGGMRAMDMYVNASTMSTDSPASAGLVFAASPSDEPRQDLLRDCPIVQVRHDAVTVVGVVVEVVLVLDRGRHGEVGGIQGIKSHHIAWIERVEPAGEGGPRMPKECANA